MARAFEEVINLNLAQFTPEAARQKHIAIARAGLARFMASQSVKPDVQIIVDGASAASEAAVRPFGVISYVFGRSREACLFAKAQAMALSPVSHIPSIAGRYRDSWFFLVKDKFTPDDEIPEGVEVILTNDQKYSRKINVGSKGFELYAHPGIIEKVKVLVLAKYGRVMDVRADFITLAGGYQLVHPIQRGRVTHTELNYPSLILTPKRFV